MSDIIIRKLQKDDLWKGFLITLDSLRQASNIDKKTAEKIFDKINSNPDHIVAVAVIEGKIVGSTTLLIETKFIHLVLLGEHKLHFEFPLPLQPLLLFLHNLSTLLLRMLSFSVLLKFQAPRAYLQYMKNS